MYKIPKWTLIIFLILFSIILGVIFNVQSRYRSQIVDEFTLSISTDNTIGIVFGAGLMPDGAPREMLKARVMKGVELLRQGKVSRLILSGDTDKGHNEPEAMKKFAMSNGAQESQLILDDNGDTTFDSCLNASRFSRRFNLLENKVILITQKFHLPRALYLCNAIGVQAIAVAASSTDSDIESAYAKREYLASIKAWLQINLPFTRTYFEK